MTGVQTCALPISDADAQGPGHRPQARLALGLGAGVIGHMAHMGYDIFNSRPVVQLLWVCIALLAVLARGRVQVAAPRFRRAVAQALAPRPTYAAVPRAGGPLG